MSLLKRDWEEVAFSDEDAPCFPLRKVARRHSISSPPDAPTAHLANENASVEEFAAFLSGAVPTSLIPPDIATYLQVESNIRFGIAQNLGKGLKDIYIGDDCLPTWEGMYWDTDEESLHSAIQSRLMDFQVSQDLGDLVRHEIIVKGNRKLDEAKRLGVELQDVAVGDSLLPIWEEVDEVDDYSSTTMTDLGDDFQDSLANSTPDACDGITSDNSPRTIASTDTTSIHSDSMSDSSSDFDEVITMNNLVAEEPIYTEPSENILHDAILVDEFNRYTGVDLEVYLVEDDDEYMNLPEAELAIDRESYEYYFGNEQAVDVEIPGVSMLVTGEIDRMNDMIEVEEAEEVVDPKAALEARKAADAAAKAFMRVRPAQVTEDMSTDPVGYHLQTVYLSDASEEVTSDDKDTPAAAFIPTEDGFRW